MTITAGELLVEEAGAPSPDPSVPLVATDVAVQFGGLRALAGVSLEVHPGETVGLIGGNGAGKTTFMDCVSGYVRPEPGSSIVSFGTELLGLSPELRAYNHLGRSYQNATLFAGLTVTEALLVAVERHQPSNLLGALLNLRGARKLEQAKRDRVRELLGTMGLERYRDTLIRQLSTGTRRIVDIASILAQSPRLLLLDEPTGGLAQRETEAFAPLLQRVRDRLGCAVLIIEHDIVLISSVCNRVYAMESGRVIAEGDPVSIRRDPKVVASYLGTDEAAIRRSGALESRPRTRRSRHRRGEEIEQASLDELTRAALVELATARGIRHSGLRKAALVEAVRARSGIT